jgi:hypothetical protein
MVQWHLEEFIRLYLKLMKDPMTLGTLFAYIIDSVSKMEGKEICYLKRMPDGSIYVFKRAYCWEGLQAWKQCPHFRCLIISPCSDLPCPDGPYFKIDPYEGLTRQEKAALIADKIRMGAENCGKQQ